MTPDQGSVAAILAELASCRPAHVALALRELADEKLESGEPRAALRLTEEAARTEHQAEAAGRDGGGHGAG